MDVEGIARHLAEVDDAERLIRRLAAGEEVPATELSVLQQDRFATGELGLTWDTISLEKVTAHLEIEDRHTQPYGIVHGGVYCSIVESLASVGAAMQALAMGRGVVGVSNTTDFLRPHRGGRVDAVGEVVHVGRSHQLWQVVVCRASDGKPVARGQVRLHHVEHNEAD